MRKKILAVSALIIAITILFTGCRLFGMEISVSEPASETEAPVELIFTGYVASDTTTAPLYIMEEAPESMDSSDASATSESSAPSPAENPGYVYTEALQLLRGTAVEYVFTNEAEYIKVKYQDGEYYIKPENLVENAADVCLEKERYVRTSATVYADSDSFRPASYALAKKGTQLEITGYDYLDENGIPNRYKVNFLGDAEIRSGWILSKYLVETKEEADAVYNEDGIYDIHKDRAYDIELYGGYAKDLDYYPVEKPSIEGNELLTQAKAIYLNCAAVDDVYSYIDLAKEYGANAAVVDIKDGILAYYSNVAEELNPYAATAYYNSFDYYKQAINALNEAGIYTIGRIVVFNDDFYAADFPEECINNEYWPSAYSRNCWYYNVSLAIEAVRSFGFREIQFDYVRFPENAYGMSLDGADFKNTYGEEKAEAIQNFLYYACDALHAEGAYVSVDVFGECTDTYVTAYGQYYPAMSNVADVISGMPYTDHWGSEVDTWTEPYDILHQWAVRTYQRRLEVPTPAVDRTWITAYDTPYWDPEVDYDAEKISQQAKALSDGGLRGGFITWNSASDIYKYYEIGEAFSQSY